MRGCQRAAAKGVWGSVKQGWSAISSVYESVRALLNQSGFQLIQTPEFQADRATDAYIFWFEYILVMYRLLSL